MIDFDAGPFLILQPFVPVDILEDAMVVIHFLPENFVVLSVNKRLLNFWLVNSRNHWFFNFLLQNIELSFFHETSKVLVSRSCRFPKLIQIRVSDTGHCLRSRVLNNESVFKVKLLHSLIILGLYFRLRLKVLFFELFEPKPIFSLFFHSFKSLNISRILVLFYNFLLHLFEFAWPM